MWRSVRQVVLALALLLPVRLDAEVPAETLQRKILDLCNDRIMGNCYAAASFLEKHAGEKKVQEALLDAYYNTPDAQCREEAMVILCHASDFVPDERFMNEVLRRMHHRGKPETLRGSGFEPAGNAGAFLLARTATGFEALIAGEINENFSGKDNSLWMQYAVVRALYKRGLLEKYADRFTPKYISKLADNLREDHIAGNAKLASYTLLFLGKLASEPLQKALRGADKQTRQLGTAILAFTNGKNNRHQLAAKIIPLLNSQEADESGEETVMDLEDLDPHVNEEIES